MNQDNHQGDQSLLDDIERRLTERQAELTFLASAESTVLDALVTTVPKADDDFKATLEAALIERLKAQQQLSIHNPVSHHQSDDQAEPLTHPKRSDSIMNMTTTAQSKWSTRRAPSDAVYGVPFTLVAVLSLLLMIGGALGLMSSNLSPQEPQPSLASGLSQAANPTQVPGGDQCATHTIQPGDTLLSIAGAYGLSTEVLIKGNNLGIIPVGALTVGETLIVDAACLAGQAVGGAWSGETRYLEPLPVNSTVAAIPVGINSGVRDGDLVDVVAILKFVDADETLQKIVPDDASVDAAELQVKIARVFSGVTVLGVDADGNVQLLVNNADKPALDYLIRASVPLILVPSEARTQQLQATSTAVVFPTATAIPPNMTPTPPSTTP